MAGAVAETADDEEQRDVVEPEERSNDQAGPEWPKPGLEAIRDVRAPGRFLPEVAQECQDDDPQDERRRDAGEVGGERFDRGHALEEDRCPEGRGRWTEQGDEVPLRANPNISTKRTTTIDGAVARGARLLLPAWSPDGGWIAFVALDGATGSLRCGSRARTE